MHTRQNQQNQQNQMTSLAGTLEKVFGVYPAASRQMGEHQALWWDMYINHPPWETCVQPLGLPCAIGRELARHVFTEFSMTVSGGARADYLDQQIKIASAGFSKDLELGLCLGGIALKPYRDGSRILVDVSETNFTPTKFDGAGKAIGGVFRTSPVRQGDQYFVRMEYHDFQNQEGIGSVYIIRNKAFQSDQSGRIGTEVSLSSVPDWDGFAPETRIEGLTGPLFAYFKPPATNDIEPDSQLGVSVYSGASVDLISQADKQWQMMDWEYRSGKRKIYIDGVEGRQFEDDLFVVGQFANNDKLFEVFSPEFRDDPLYNGFQRILQRIEFNVGMAYGTISDPQTVERTATEVLSAKHRQYVTECAIKKQFQAALDDLLYAMDSICDLARLAPAGDYKAEYNWGDGVLDDPDTKRQDMAMDAALVDKKLLSPWEFRMKWYGEDEAAAKKRIAEIDAETEEVDPALEDFE